MTFRGSHFDAMQKCRNAECAPSALPYLRSGRHDVRASPPKPRMVQLIDTLLPAPQSSLFLHPPALRFRKVYARTKDRNDHHARHSQRPPTRRSQRASCAQVRAQHTQSPIEETDRPVCIEPAVGCLQTIVSRKNGLAMSPSTSTRIPKSWRP